MLSLHSGNVLGRAIVSAPAPKPVASYALGIQVGADDHAGQDPQATQPDLLLFLGQLSFLLQGFQPNGESSLTENQALPAGGAYWRRGVYCLTELMFCYIAVYQRRDRAAMNFQRFRPFHQQVFALLGQRFHKN